MRRPNASAALLAGLLAAACAETAAPLPPGAPARMDILEGNGQVDTVGQRLPVALAVRVVDSDDRPVAGQTVNFRVVAGGGSVFAGAATTNADGLARERWTLGTVAGDTQRVEVRAVHPVTGDEQVFGVFTAVGVPDAAAQIEPVGPTARAGAAGLPLADSLGVRLRDQHGNPTPGVPVTWTTDDGSLSPTLDGTGGGGVSRSQWTLGTRTDSVQHATATAGALSVVFTAVAGIPAGSTLRKVSGDDQVGTVGRALADSLVVRVLHPDGRPLSGVEVRWVPDPDGIASPPISRTDASGFARTHWTLQTRAGTPTLRAFLPTGGNVAFNATANAGPPVAIQKVQGDGQTGLPDARLPVDLAVRLVDQYGNGVQGRFVTWTVLQGGGSASPAGGNTAGGGLARTGWTLGAAGPQRMRAASGSLTPRDFTANAVPANAVEPQAMTIRTGEVDSARVNFYGNTTAGAVWTSLDSTIAFVARNPVSPYRSAAILGKKPGTTGIVVKVGTFFDTVQVTVQPITEQFTTLSAGLASVCAVTTSGAAYCWGSRIAGSAAPNEAGRHEAPVRYTTALGATWLHLNEPNQLTELGACAGTAAGDVFCWGRPRVVTMRDTLPGPLPGTDDWRKVEIDRLHGCGIRTDDSLVCWGSGPSGSEGNGFPGMEWLDVATGRNHSCGIQSDGSAWCWGLDAYGQLGSSTPLTDRCWLDGGPIGDDEYPCTADPVLVDGGRTYTRLDAYYHATCALATDGTAWCWGPGYGEAPVSIAGHQFTSIEVGPGGTCAVGTDGLAYCWTPAQRNAVPPPVSTTLTFRHVEPLSGAACGISTSNVIYCWGTNTYGQLGTGDTASRAAPTRVVGQP